MHPQKRVVQVVKWQEQLVRRYELEVAKRLFWHFILFVIVYTVAILMISN